MCQIVQSHALLSLFYQELGEVDLMMNDAREDQDLKELAKEERTRISQIVEDIEKTLFQSLIPKDIADSGNAILEIRAGTRQIHACILFVFLLCRYDYIHNILICDNGIEM